MMKTFRVLPVLIGLGFLMACGRPIQAQETPPPPPPQQHPDSVDLKFEREAFVYPRYERRDPFKPLLDDNLAGPRIEEIELKGIVFSPDPDLSVATFGLRSGQSGGATSGQSYRVRRGQVLGNVRILEIHQTRVVVQIEEFGLTEQRVLELPRPGEGGLR